jgi:DedD protein
VEPQPAVTKAAPQGGATGSAREQAAAGKPAEGWAVQVGSFSQEKNAERVAAELEKTGFRAYVSRLEQSGRVLYRVRVGPVASREEAEQLAKRLRGAGRRAQVMPHP